MRLSEVGRDECGKSRPGSNRGAAKASSGRLNHSVTLTYPSVAKGGARWPRQATHAAKQGRGWGRCDLRGGRHPGQQPLFGRQVAMSMPTSRRMPGFESATSTCEADVLPTRAQGPDITLLAVPRPPASARFPALRIRCAGWSRRCPPCSLGVGPPAGVKILSTNTPLHFFFSPHGMAPKRTSKPPAKNCDFGRGVKKGGPK